MKSTPAARCLSAMVPAMGLLVLVVTSCAGSGGESRSDAGDLTADVLDVAETTVPSDAPETTDNCTPNCSGRECGRDGCGGACGFCADSVCQNQTGQCSPKIHCLYQGYRACAGDGWGACGQFWPLEVVSYVNCHDAPCVDGRCACTFVECAGKCCAHGEFCQAGACCTPGSTAKECTLAASEEDRCRAVGGVMAPVSPKDFSVTKCVDFGADFVLDMPVTEARLFPTPTANGGFVVAADDQGVWSLDAMGKVLWHTAIAGEVLSRPAIGRDGMVLVASTDRRVHALAADGSPTWQFKTSGWLLGAPVVATDGTVYVAGTDRQVHALAPDGSAKWMYDSGAAMVEPLLLLEDGTLLVVTKAGVVHAIHADGSPSWVSDASVLLESAPALMGEGIVAAGRNGLLATLDKANGHVVTSFHPSRTLTLAPSATADVLVAALDGLDFWGDCPDDGLYAGEPWIWSLVDGAPSTHTQTVARFGRSTGEFCLTDSFRLKGHVNGPAVIDDAGTVFVATREGSLIARSRILNNRMDFGGKNPSWEIRLPGGIDSPPVVSGNRVVVGCRDGHLYGISRPRVIDVSAGATSSNEARSNP